MGSIEERILKKAKVPRLLELLAEDLSPTDLQSLLLAVYRRMTGQRKPAQVQAAFAADRFVTPSPISPVRLLNWEQTAYKALPEDFEALLLSPVSPLGTSSVVGGINQNRVLTTCRNNEVNSDPTNTLALVCAQRRLQLLKQSPKSKHPVHLATAQRVVRAEKYSNPNFYSHFSLFALCSSARDPGSHRFELDTLRQHLGIHIRAITDFLDEECRMRVLVSDFSGQIPQSKMEDLLLTPLNDTHPNLEASLDPTRTQALGYYLNLCFKLQIYLPAAREWREVGDGGAVDWTRKLMGNAKERCVISGLGSDHLCQM